MTDPEARERMTDYVQRLQFGNEVVGPELTEFWLDGSLQVSAAEQVEWWRLLHEAELPVGELAREQVLDMTVLAQDERAVLRGKTGWASNPIGGWFVGSLEDRASGAVTTFAVHLAQLRGIAVCWRAIGGALLVGVLAGMHKGSALDRTLSTAAIATTATPEYVSGVVFITR